MVDEATLSVEVAYATPDEQLILPVQLAAGSTVRQAIEQSGILERYPAIDLTQAKVGVFGKITRPDTPLKEGDRVEIYRPLIADPKEVRRRRAAAGKGKASKKDGAD